MESSYIWLLMFCFKNMYGGEMDIQEYLEKINLNNKLSDREKQLILLIKENDVEEEFNSLVLKIIKRENQIKREEERKKYVESMIRHRRACLLRYFEEKSIPVTLEWVQNYIEKDLEEFSDKVKKKYNTN